MDRNGILRLLWLLFFLFSDASNASFLSKIRQLAALKDGNNPIQIQVSPSPSPVPANTLNTTKPEGNSVLKADNSTSINNSSISSNIDNKSNNSDNNNTGIVGPSSILGNRTDREVEKNNDETKKVSEEKDHHKTDSEAEVGGENCTTLGTKRCTDLKSMSACILGFDSEFQCWTVLIQNSGEDNLSVDVVAPDSADNALVFVGKHQSKKVWILFCFFMLFLWSDLETVIRYGILLKDLESCSQTIKAKQNKKMKLGAFVGLLFKRVLPFAFQINLTVGENTEVKLNAKNGECVLHLDPLESHGNFFLHLPSYDQLITPINGAYFLIITAVVFGGTFTCCMFRKRRREAGTAYQELEMAMPESGVANIVETAEGWDKDWDDNWDEENAIKSPASRHSASVSANGLTSRSSNKDGWDNDWDD
ncbi:hypothetical protein DKX38_009556 [Salix brachista]|uniref:DUF7356 domain-containing protein n=1 Tax=Salix brachista TaxID=2182728 RepID=A0A5N5MAP9_9ROSI|nr:hypothetical protein DKX38_009556 [Salix brachista]